MTTQIEERPQWEHRIGLDNPSLLASGLVSSLLSAHVLTIGDAAEQWGVGLRTVGHWLGGTATPNFESFIRLLKSDGDALAEGLKPASHTLLGSLILSGAWTPDEARSLLGELISLIPHTIPMELQPA